MVLSRVPAEDDVGEFGDDDSSRGIGIHFKFNLGQVPEVLCSSHYTEKERVREVHGHQDISLGPSHRIVGFAR